MFHIRFQRHKIIICVSSHQENNIKVKKKMKKGTFCIKNSKMKIQKIIYFHGVTVRRDARIFHLLFSDSVTKIDSTI